MDSESGKFSRGLCVEGLILSLALGSDDTFKKWPRGVSSGHMGMRLKGL